MRTLNLIFGTCGLVACVVLVPTLYTLGASNLALAGGSLMAGICGLNGGHLLRVSLTGSDRDQFTV
jgi:hypothetical protein